MRVNARVGYSKMTHVACNEMALCSQGLFCQVVLPVVLPVVLQKHVWCAMEWLCAASGCTARLYCQVAQVIAAGVVGSALNSV